MVGGAGLLGRDQRGFWGIKRLRNADLDRNANLDSAKTFEITPIFLSVARTFSYTQAWV